MAKKSLSDLVKGVERYDSVGVDVLYSTIMDGVRALENTPIKVSAKLSGGQSVPITIAQGDIPVPHLGDLVDVEYVVTVPGQNEPLMPKYAKPLLLTLLEFRNQFSRYVQDGCNFGVTSEIRSMDSLKPDALTLVVMHELGLTPESGGVTVEGSDYILNHVSPILDVLREKVDALEGARAKDKAVIGKLVEKKSELETYKSQLQTGAEEARKAGELLKELDSAYGTLTTKANELADGGIKEILRKQLEGPYESLQALQQTVEGLGQTTPGLEAQINLLDLAIQMFETLQMDKRGIHGGITEKYSVIPGEMERMEAGDSGGSIIHAIRYVKSRLNGQSFTNLARALRRKSEERTETLVLQVQEANTKIGDYIKNLRAAVTASELALQYGDAVKTGDVYQIMPLLQRLGESDPAVVHLEIKPNEKALRQAAEAVYHTLEGLYKDAVSFPDELRQAAVSLASCRNATITGTGMSNLYRIAAADMARMNTPKPTTN